MSTPTPVEIELDGKTYAGTWSADGHLLTTRYRDRALTDEVRTTAPAIAARSMLQRLVRLAHEQHEQAGG
ncbi:MAG: hypothetical protein R3C13_03345 [Hyphomonas sp.]|uniref:hypothetical protein n=1 Tax=Hyphomonas sp. TaxID=87 RepID=UPI0035289533